MIRTERFEELYHQLILTRKKLQWIPTMLYSVTVPIFPPYFNLLPSFKTRKEDQNLFGQPDFLPKPYLLLIAEADSIFQVQKPVLVRQAISTCISLQTIIDPGVGKETYTGLIHWKGRIHTAWERRGCLVLSCQA